MRVSQIQNLTWAGNVLVLGGLAWVGLKFWEVTKQNKQKSAEIVWPKAKSDDVGKSRWPGDLAAFKHIWDTPVNGKVPPPPPPKEAPVVKIDKVAEFRSKLKYMGGGWEFMLEPDRSAARINFDSKDLTVVPGESVGGFQLKQFLLMDDPDPKKRTVRFVFANPDGGPDVVIDQPASLVPAIVDPSGGPVRKGGYADPVREGVISENHVGKTAYTNAQGEWVIPDDERLWLETYGETKLWSKLPTKPELGKDGVARGLRIMQFPETGTPLAKSHGIGQGDVVVAINGVAVASKEDILNYLRGDGRGLERYVVDVETDGARRQVVYLVRRVKTPARAAHPARD